MIGGVVIQKQGPTPGILAKERNRVQRECFYEAGAFWHSRMLRHHFTRQAFSRYSAVYKRRKFKYEKRKLRMFGHTNPLVYSGESRRLALSIQDVRATSRGNRIVLHSRKLNFKHPKSQINMREELTYISPAEEQGIGNVFDREFQEGIDRIRSAENEKVA